MSVEHQGSYTGKHWPTPPKKGIDMRTTPILCIVCGRTLCDAAVFGDHRPAEAHATCKAQGAANVWGGRE